MNNLRGGQIRLAESHMLPETSTQRPLSQINDTW
jgi:hypothetical protein